VSLLEPPPRTDPDALARIRGWAHELWNLPDEATVIVSELRCAEPGCQARRRRDRHRPARSISR
jgi:hypothetical protein